MMIGYGHTPDRPQTYRLFNNVLGQFMPGHITTSRAHALRWLHGCQPFMQVVRDLPTCFGEIIAHGGDKVYEGGAIMTSAAKDKAKALRASIETDLEALAKAVDDVRASEMFTRYLDVQAKFHHYSWHNTMLIASQRPNATQVAGFKTWQKMGRQVRKGERGIAIFAPCRFKREVENSDGDTDTVEGLFFRVVHVFDVSQTDGESLPTVDVPTVDIVADELLGQLRQVAVKRGITVLSGPLASGAFGASMNGAVNIDDTHATGQQAKTLAHELAHESLHWDVKGTFTRNIAELEAESVAYVVCTHFGLDVEVRASRYIALWGGDSKAVRESLERIANTARAIIDDVESLENRKAVA